ncbi:dihydrofolate reductase-like domain-containing protein [Aspergillus cavernicola]|uniref:2,5-diamino-6-ribosylamino-4(3H)-pyrimidinone 5'-phosphate reductase n=1 Tax=Aspergillus cavernicola TaxID=176166 RepID=A0ABR4HF15_9EURO
MDNRTWKARVFAATSLDGFIARKNNDILWLTQPKPNPAHTRPSSPKKTLTFEQHISEVDFIIMGRETFQVCLSLPEWPYPPSKNLLVLSTTLQFLPTLSNIPASSSPTPTSTPIPQPEYCGVVASLDETETILAKKGAKMVYVDGGKTVQGFLTRGWVDELVLTHAPILLGAGNGDENGDGGGGRPLFSHRGLRVPEDVRFTLVGVDVIEDGMVSSYYRVLRP